MASRFETNPGYLLLFLGNKMLNAHINVTRLVLDVTRLINDVVRDSLDANRVLYNKCGMLVL